MKPWSRLDLMKLDGYEDPCNKCGHGTLNFGHIRPDKLMNYMLLKHAKYLKDAVIKNIDYLNSVNHGMEKDCLYFKTLPIR